MMFSFALCLPKVEEQRLQIITQHFVLCLFVNKQVSKKGGGVYPLLSY